jgi:hypothetical protein
MINLGCISTFCDALTVVEEKSVPRRALKSILASAVSVKRCARSRTGSTRASGNVAGRVVPSCLSRHISRPFELSETGSFVLCQ